MPKKRFKLAKISKKLFKKTVKLATLGALSDIENGNFN